MTPTADDLTKFQWSPQPQAAALVQELLDDFLRRCPDAAKFADRLSRETGTRLVDWIDHLAYAPDQQLTSRLARSGFEFDDGRGFWRHSGGLFPPVRVLSGVKSRLAFKVESVVDFAFAHGLRVDAIELPPLAPLRTLKFVGSQDSEMEAVERHGWPVLDVPCDVWAEGILEYDERFRLRQRHFSESVQGFEYAHTLIDNSIAEIGVDRTADLFFATEREYWMSRNRAAQVQYARQQKLGLGWANHDHHTYRSSREHFKDLIAIMEKLGLVCRERFYAGREAGWGAQVMENANAGIVVFADVDLLPEEVTGDFAHEPLPPRKELGTVGLWCRLHGEAFLEAGMHHLECQFDFDAAREQLKREGVDSMKPFTDFDYLKQAFTKGEVWPVDLKRIDALLSEGYITPEQAEKFRREGALGSHLEVLQRNDGYKGFNQTGISEIIRDTDPRRTHAGA